MDAKNLKIAYVGGGSRAWAHRLMTDLAKEPCLSGVVKLYDIDKEAALVNQTIGNNLSQRKDIVGKWQYTVCDDIEEALTGADFVILSILPATFDEMQSDVHTPEEFGIYQSVGDTTGPGGIVRALRTVPMYEHFAKKIEKCCPNAWVINYTNPMAVCVRTLYRVFPAIKAYGCCHEVFHTQDLLAEVIERDKSQIYTNVIGVNHFTFITQATCDGYDILPAYKRFVEKNYISGYQRKGNEPFPESYFGSLNKVKFDLFRRFGIIAAAGDRHLAEFCPKNWYLKSEAHANSWGFNLTPVSYRKDDLLKRKQKCQDLLSGRIPFDLSETGEEGVKQIKTLVLGGEMVTNVNLPNNSQIDGIKQGLIVESNVKITKNNMQPVYAGVIPASIKPHIEKALSMQELVVEAALSGDYELAFIAFCNDNLNDLSLQDSRKLFDKMLYNTKEYLPHYNDYIAKRRLP